MKKTILYLILLLSNLCLFVGPFLSYWATNIQTWNPSSNSQPNTQSNAGWWDWWWDCIKLNTDFPWVWKCIKPDDAQNAFWKIMWWLMKLLLNMSVAIAFISLIAAWIMYSVSWVDQNIAWKWKDLLKKVILWIVLLWLSWLILHTINPNFFSNKIYFILAKKI